MIKKRYFSIDKDFKTGFFFKLFLLIGVIFLIFFIFIRITALFIDKDSTGFAKQLYDFSQTSYPNSLFAFSIIFLAVAVIFYFFYSQFVKLAKIADEMDKEEDSDELTKE